MKSFKQFITEGKYDALKKEFMDSKVVRKNIDLLKSLKNYQYDLAYNNRGNINHLVLRLVPKYGSSVEGSIYMDIHNWDGNLKGYDANGEGGGYGIGYLNQGAEVIEVTVPDENEILTKNVEIKFDNTKAEGWKRHPEQKILSTMTYTFPFLKSRITLY